MGPVVVVELLVVGVTAANAAALGILVLGVQLLAGVDLSLTCGARPEDVNDDRAIYFRFAEDESGVGHTPHLRGVWGRDSGAKASCLGIV